MITSGRSLVPQIVNTFAWAFVLRSPWSEIELGLLILFAVHVVQPWWSAWVDTGTTRQRFNRGPLALFGVDALALAAAWMLDTWGRLNGAIVPVLAVLCVLALAYGAIIVTWLGRRRDRRAPRD